MNEKLVNEYRDKVSEELFHKHEYKLQIRDQQVLSDYIRFSNNPPASIDDDREFYSNKIYEKPYNKLNPDEKLALNVYIYKLSHVVFGRYFHNGVDTGLDVATMGAVISESGNMISQFSAYPNGGKKNAKSIDNHYLVIRPRMDDGKYHTYYVHRMVAITHIPNPFNKPEVNHMDEDKTNEDISNLEWVNRKENVIHRYTMNPYDGSLGENSHFNRYTEEQVVRACELMSTRPEMSDSWVSRQSGVSTDMLPYLRSKKNWRYITEDYDFPPKPAVWFTNDKSAREFELLKQGLSIYEVVDKIIQEFDLNIERKKLYSQIKAMQHDWIAKGALPDPKQKEK